MSEVQKAPRKEDRRVRRTKRMLTQALTTLMQQKQINEITVKELTDLADMNRGTFYLYYRDIYDMLEKVEDSLFTSLDAIVTQHINEDHSLQSEALLTDLFAFIGDNHDMCQVLLSPHGDMNFLHKLNEVLREKCMKAYTAVSTDQNVSAFDYRYSFFTFGCAGLIRAWLNRGCAESPAEIATLANKLIFKGSTFED